MSQAGTKSAHSVDGYEAFRQRAADGSLSQYEKIGFPDSYRAGKSELILADIESKVTNLLRPGSSVLDVGCGCSELPILLIEKCVARQQDLVLLDSEEMLAPLPADDRIKKVTGPFPQCADRLAVVCAKFDAILVYSVIQYVFQEGNLWAFVDRLASLLKPGGQLLLGDIPNASRRRRFLASDAGQAHHRARFGDAPPPVLDFNELCPDQIDDAVVLGMIARMRAAGFDCFVLPQGPELPMANRREDILIRRF